MQVLQAGPHKLILLELDLDLVMNIARQAGFEVKSEDTARSLILDLNAPGRQAPLLLFDAADQAGISREYGGIHFNDGDYEARQAGEDIGLLVWGKAKSYFNGKAIAKT